MNRDFTFGAIITAGIDMLQQQNEKGTINFGQTFVKSILGGSLTMCISNFLSDDEKTERNTNKYFLIKNNKIVYAGITNKPKKRVTQHKKDKSFDYMQVIGNKSTRKGAEDWETKTIQKERKNGNPMIYNKTKNGK